ncbi:MAG TPA: serine/threonine-protein kinase, partial [Polyangiaceae bacterium]|nr:serine/threonine-protein kinase [Polyangiaceae bacterium]
DRVARLGAAIFLMALAMGVASVATHVATAGAGTENGGLAHEILHVAALTPALAVWLRCRGKLMSTAVVEAIDAGLTITACILYAMLGMSASSSLSVAFSVPLAMSYTLLGRSIIVPSSYWRTLLISAAGAAATIVYFKTQGVSAAFGQSPESGRVFVLFGTSWCAFAVFAAAANSRQLYGLRARIREIGKLGQYTLEAKIGEGGMGAVYKAAHAMLRRPAAIKLLTKDSASEKDLARFEREVQLTSTLTHPNTIAIFDYGRTAEGVFYYVMEYLDGLDLDRLVKEHGPLEPARVIHILAQVCGALVEAHALQLIHRDIKPANIVLTGRVDEPDVVKVVDFGLVKTLATNGAESRSDAITGTPMYLSPEAIRTPDAVDERTDIYALGAVAYFLLSGREVFSGETVLEVLSRHLLEAPLPPSSHLTRALPADLERLVLQCLAKDPGGRPQSASSLRASLLACEDAARYNRSQAFAWWLAHRPQRHTGAVPLATGSAATMAVDLRRRAAPPAARLD